MRIKTKLNLIPIISIVLFFILLLEFLVTSSITEKANERHALAEEINNATADLDFLITDYLLNREKRILRQWESRYISGLSILQNAEEEEEKELVRGIINDYLLLGRIFNKEVEDYGYVQKLIKEGTSQDELSLSEELRKIRISRLLITLQSIASSSNILEREAASRLASLSSIRGGATIFFIIISFAFMITIPMEIAKYVTRSFYKLRAGAEIIGRGNLDYEIDIDSKDEIGYFANAFNQMAVSLKTITVSKDILEKEISKRKESEEKFRAVVETAFDAIISSDSGGVIIFWNRGAERMFGYEANEVLGKSLTIIMPDEYKAAHLAGMKRLVEGGQPRLIGKSYEVMGMRKNGEKFPLELALSSWRVEGGQFYTAILRDITERKRIETMKSEFISIASHQLKTPLTAIGWITERLLDGKAGKLSQKQKDYLSNIHSSNGRMVKLVDDLLSVSRLEEGKIRMESRPLQLENIITKIIKDIQLVKKQCRILFDRPEEKLPLIPLDESLIEQALGNLLINAIRYSKNDCQIEVKLQKNDKNLLLVISDKGIGIPKDKQYRVFEKFFRADNAQKLHPDGTGLGLYITKMIISLLGGKIWFESEENKGTTFFVELLLIHR